jgi:hypothetical protein
LSVLTQETPPARPSKLLLRLSLAGSFALAVPALILFFQPFYLTGRLFYSKKALASAVGAGLGAVLLLALLILTWTPWWEPLQRKLRSAFGLFQRLGRLNLLFVVGGIGLLAFLVAGPSHDYFRDPVVRLFILWLAALSGSLFLGAAGVGRTWVERLGLGLLLAAAGYRIAAYIPDVSTFPFSLSWSEASRYYYASLFASQRLYGFSLPPSVLHPTRYLMQAVPFLIQNSPLWLHRLWQVLLWIGVTAVTAWSLTRRLSISEKPQAWMLAAWAFMFLLVGPVYYHLQVPVILVLLGFDCRRLWRSLGVVLLASVWAGVSRVNWFPVPGMLAAALYFMESPLDAQPWWRYLLPPAAWTLAGTATAFVTQAAYILWSGNPSDQFSSSLSSDLLWYRLFPSPTYPPGILLAVLLFLLPLLAVLWSSLRTRWRAYHLLRLLGLGAILLVLFAGGLLVSVKIGGGSNLHNLDAFLSLLLVIFSYELFGRLAPEGPAPLPASRPWWGFVILALLLPIVFTLPALDPPVLPDQKTTQAALDDIREIITQAADEGGQVLFLSERQLLIFGYVPKVTLVPDYEKVFLMEMAMADNPNYLGAFYQALKDHQYRLIVSEPLYLNFQGSESSFGEENDAWVKRVSHPILCYYEPDKTYRAVRTQLLVPRTTPDPNCP